MTNEHDDSGRMTMTLPRPRDRASQTDFLRELSLARRCATVPSTSEGETVEAPWTVDFTSGVVEPAGTPEPADARVTNEIAGAAWGGVATDAALRPASWFDHASASPGPQPVAPSVGLFDIMPVTTWPGPSAAEGRSRIDDATDLSTQSDLDDGATTSTFAGPLETLPATTWPSLVAPAEPNSFPASMVMPAGRPPVVTSAAPVAVRCSGLVASRIARGRRHTVLSGVDLTVRSGEVAVLTGRSGSGKSTLLECLAGLHRIDTGTVMIGETSLGDATDEQMADLRATTIGYVAQEPRLLADLSAIENIELPLLLIGWDAAEARTEANAAVALVRLAFPDHRTSELSAGERRRVAIARALVGEPAVLWLDEASAAIDPGTMAEIYDLIFDLCQDGLAVVAVTHDPVLLACANTTYELCDGSLQPVVT